MPSICARKSVWPVAARAQQSDVRRVAVLMPYAEDDPEGQARVMALKQRLEKLGWTIDRNIRIDCRWGIDDIGKTRAAAAELLALAPDVIMAGTSRAVATLQHATHAVPIVFTAIYEPVAQGFVQSLAHPGGNITGFTMVEASLGAKWLELLKKIAPSISTVAFIFNPNNPGPAQTAHSAETAAPNFGVQMVMAPVQGLAEIEAAMATLGRKPGGGLIVPSDGFLMAYRKSII
jgi:putative ABC transport system substrate-binding protein